MASRPNERLVYSTGDGSMCPRCGWPAATCRCSSRGGEEPVPVRVVARLRVEKAGRGGKTVTVVYDLRDGAVEIQGDLRDRVREVLLEKGIGVKG
jgi:translation initiation factor 1